MKSKRILVVLLAVLALFSSIGSVGAYMRKQTQVVSSVYIPGTVSCTVHETLTGKTEKRSITVENTGSITSYIRVRLVTYWVDSHGDIMYKASSNLNMDSIYNTTDWIKAPNEDLFYYKYPVAPDGNTGDVTADLLKNGSVITLQRDNNGTNSDTSDDLRQVVEVFAEAIQSEPTKAVTEAWKVTIDSSGNITGLK